MIIPSIAIKCMIALNFFSPEVLPPENVVASQSINASSDTPIVMSWSPPSSGADIITGYRIFYGNGENVSVYSVITSVGLIVNTDYLGQSVSIQSESDGLISELVTVSVVAGECDSDLIKPSDGIAHFNVIYRSIIIIIIMIMHNMLFILNIR